MISLSCQYSLYYVGKCHIWNSTSLLSSDGDIFATIIFTKTIENLGIRSQNIVTDLFCYKVLAVSLGPFHVREKELKN